ncbi:MAG TPA: hypothetical protein VFA04_21840 [Bryobacteraceae bacterium]|nr:hypothetical protein [Bryobacteraceae bacterium]
MHDDRHELLAMAVGLPDVIPQRRRPRLVSPAQRDDAVHVPLPVTHDFDAARMLRVAPRFSVM